MFKKATLMFLYTETSLHAGSGTSLGVVDLPIQREKYTDFPMIQASGIKGAVREWFEFQDHAHRRKIELTFGPDKIGSEESGFAAAITFTDARILLFPVRSLKGIFAYCTSPTVLERFRRDAQIAGVPLPTNWNVPKPTNDQIVLGVRDGCDVADGNQVLLEEYAFGFEPKQEVFEIAQWLSQHAFPKGGEYEFWREKVKRSLLVLPDNAFRDFVKLSTEVQARIKIDNEKRTVVRGGLFYEEALPADSLLYSVVLAHDPLKDDRAELPDVKSVLSFLREIDAKRLQLGGDATLGRGIVSVRFYAEEQKQEPSKEGEHNG